MSRFEIRCAAEYDIPAITALYRELYDTLAGMSFPFVLNDEVLADILVTLIKSKLCLLLVAEGDGEIAGFLSASISKMDRKFSRGNEFIGKIADICVTASARRYGVASMLLIKAEDWLRECGCSAVECNIACENLPSRSFFKKNGYEEFSLLCIKNLKLVAEAAHVVSSK